MAASFARLLRYSKFVRLGDFENRLLVGKIVHRVGEDLYVDMGLKFNAVCSAPLKSTRPTSVSIHASSSPYTPSEFRKYTIGSQVIVRLNDPELSERFLGADKDLTILEADATILGLYDPNRRRGGDDGAQRNGRRAPVMGQRGGGVRQMIEFVPDEDRQKDG